MNLSGLKAGEIVVRLPGINAGEPSHHTRIFNQGIHLTY